MGYESALAYEQVLDLHPNNYDISFSAQIKRAENFDVYMEDISIIEKELRKMLKDDKNISYRDQIYYVWALKELDLDHYPEGDASAQVYIVFGEQSKTERKSYLKLAGVEFDFRSLCRRKAITTAHWLFCRRAIQARTPYKSALRFWASLFSILTK